MFGVIDVRGTPLGDDVTRGGRLGTTSFSWRISAAWYRHVTYYWCVCVWRLACPASTNDGHSGWPLYSVTCGWRGLSGGGGGWRQWPGAAAVMAWRMWPS